MTEPRQVRVNADGSFAVLPAQDAEYLSPAGEIVTVASCWSHGVVLKDIELCISATDLVSRYKPRCPICRAFHEPEYPHQMTPAYSRHLLATQGREPEQADTFAHCSGLMRAAAEIAIQGD